MTPEQEQRANDIIQAFAKQRNEHADDAAGLFADLMAAKREIEQLKAQIARLNEPEPDHRGGH